MPQLRGLLIALVALIVLGGGVLLSNKYKKDAEKKGSADAPKILSIAEDQIQQLEIKRRDGSQVTLKKGDKWQITAPEALNADQDAISSITSTVSSLASERIVEENATDLANYGLTNPQLQLSVLQKDGKTTKLLLGDDTATGNGVYAKLDGDPKVYTIGSFNKTSIDKTAADLRDKRLVLFDSDKLTRVELTSKGGTVEFGKNAQNEWQIVKPRPMRADNWAVEELVRKVKEAKMEGTGADGDKAKTEAAFAGALKVGLVKVTDAKGTYELDVRMKDGNHFARGSSIAGIYKVPNDLATGLDVTIDSFRNKKLFDFGFNDPSKVEVKDDKGQSKVYQKSGEKWMAGSQEMDSVSIQSFVDKLRDLSAEKFQDSGFSSPVFEVKLTAKDGKIVDHIQIAKDSLAIRVGEPTVYALKPESVAELVSAAGSIKAPAPPEKKKDDAKKK